MHKLRVLSLSLLLVATQQSFGLNLDAAVKLSAVASFSTGLACAYSDCMPNKSAAVLTGLGVSGICSLGTDSFLFPDGSTLIASPSTGISPTSNIPAIAAVELVTDLLFTTAALSINNISTTIRIGTFLGSLAANIASYTAGYGIGYGLKQLSNRNNDE